MNTDRLENRSLIRIAGVDAEHFLENLITCDITNLESGDCRFGALLSPQGKILYDFFVIRTDYGYLIDVNQSQFEELAKRLMFYRLRAKVEIEIQPPVIVTIHMEAEQYEGLAVKDPRHDDLGYRIYEESSDSKSTNHYNDRRVQLGIPEGSIDFEYGDAYPHEVLMDQFGGVNFKKGCYVGQEVVSRMQHRGTTKKRIVHVSSEGDLPVSNTPITGDGKPVGTLGTVAGNRGLALLRLDRAQKASELLAGDVSITASIPDWVNFSWPEVG